MYLFSGVAICTSSVSLLCGAFADFFFEELVILSSILLPIKSPLASVVFSFALFEEVFIASVADFLELSRSY